MQRAHSYSPVPRVINSCHSLMEGFGSAVTSPGPMGAPWPPVPSAGSVSWHTLNVLSQKHCWVCARAAPRVFLLRVSRGGVVAPCPHRAPWGRSAGSLLSLFLHCRHPEAECPASISAPWRVLGASGSAAIKSGAEPHGCEQRDVLYWCHCGASSSPPHTPCPGRGSPLCPHGRSQAALVPPSQAFWAEGVCATPARFWVGSPIKKSRDVGLY